MILGSSRISASWFVRGLRGSSPPPVSWTFFEALYTSNISLWYIHCHRRQDILTYPWYRIRHYPWGKSGGDYATIFRMIRLMLAPQTNQTTFCIPANHTLPYQSAAFVIVVSYVCVHMHVYVCVCLCTFVYTQLVSNSAPTWSSRSCLGLVLPLVIYNMANLLTECNYNGARLETNPIRNEPNWKWAMCMFVYVCIGLCT